MQLIPRRADLQALIQLAVPIVTVQVGQMLLGVVDTIMVGHISANALAAVALGNLYFFALTVFGSGVLFALDPLVAQAVGARDYTAIAQAVQRGFVIALIAAVFLAALMPLCGPLLRLLHQPPHVIPVASTYVLVITPSVLPLMGFVVLRQTLQALGRVRPVVLAIIGANICNAVLNWILIFGHLGAPALGVVGSAIATTISRFGMFAALLLVAWPLVAEYLRPRRDILVWQPIAAMLRIGIPVGLGQFVEFINFGGIALLMGLLGTNEVAAHQVAINIASLTFMVPAGIASAAAVLVGHAIGAGDADGARNSARASLFAAVMFMSCSALVMLSAPEVLARIYTSDAAVLSIAVVLLPIAGIFQVFDGLQVVGQGVLRGAGDTHAPALIAAAGFWLVGMPTSVYFGLFTSARAAGLWWGFVAGLASVAMALLLRIRARFAGELVRVVA